MPIDTEVGLDPADIVFDGYPAPATERALHWLQPLTLRPMCIAVKQSPISATAEVLFYIRTILLFITNNMQIVTKSLFINDYLLSFDMNDEMSKI